MNDTPTVTAARRFLHLALEGTPPTDAMMARGLSELALAYCDVPEGDPADDDADDQQKTDDYQHRYANLGARFPNFGYYAVADPLGPVDQEIGLGDAIDDLADITHDLGETLWRFEHFGAADAHWHFKFNYEIHWGKHLRELSCYLHAKNMS